MPNAADATRALPRGALMLVALLAVGQSSTAYQPAQPAQRASSPTPQPPVATTLDALLERWKGAKVVHFVVRDRDKKHADVRSSTLKFGARSGDLVDATVEDGKAGPPLVFEVKGESLLLDTGRKKAGKIRVERPKDGWPRGVAWAGLDHTPGAELLASVGDTEEHYLICLPAQCLPLSPFGRAWEQGVPYVEGGRAIFDPQRTAKGSEVVYEVAQATAKPRTLKGIAYVCDEDISKLKKKNAKGTIAVYLDHKDPPAWTGEVAADAPLAAISVAVPPDTKHVAIRVTFDKSLDGSTVAFGGLRLEDRNP